MFAEIFRGSDPPMTRGGNCYCSPNKHDQRRLLRQHAYRHVIVGQHIRAPRENVAFEIKELVTLRIKMLYMCLHNA